MEMETVEITCETCGGSGQAPKAAVEHGHQLIHTFPHGCGQVARSYQA